MTVNPKRALIKSLARVWQLILPWAPFLVILAWAWRVENPFQDVAAYGDTLSVVWGAMWYRKAILTPGVNPLFYPLAFHPIGLSTAVLAHPPSFFALTLPFTLLFGPVFAVNLITVLSVFVGYAGAYRFARLFVSPKLAVMAALAFTFAEFRWFRVFGHINILSATALLPWLAWRLERLRRSAAPDTSSCLLAGAIWGAMIDLCLYSIFLGGITFALWGGQLLKGFRLRQAGQIALLALLVGSPALVLFAVGRQQNALAPIPPSELLHWSASLNSFFAPSVFHPLAPVQKLARAIYSGPVDESGTANLGLVTCILGIVGAVIAIRKRDPAVSGLSWLTTTGMLLSLGLLLRWNGRIISLSWLRPANQILWQAGHVLKPAIFTSAAPPPPFDAGIPLPNLVLTALVPFWESARTVSRYAIVGSLGMVALAARGLRALPRPAQTLLALIWLIEIWPRPTGSLAFPTEQHQAYTWVAEQDLAAGEGIVEIDSTSIMRQGEVLLATWFDDTPTAAGADAFVPGHTRFLYDLLANDQALASTDIGAILRQYQIRYTMLYIRGDEEKKMWAMVEANPTLRPIGCFEPPPAPTPWHYRICIAEVPRTSWSSNVLLTKGWSPSETWGVWANNTESRASWLAMSVADHQLILEAFPLCLPDRRQQISIRVNGRDMATHEWQDCTAWHQEIEIPASLIRLGQNEVSFHYAYASEPIDATTGAATDSRALAVGFTRLVVNWRSGK